MKIRRSNLRAPSLGLILSATLAAPLETARGELPSPPPGGWPSAPRPVSRAEIPASCGGWLHNLACPQDSDLETALEAEYWRIVGNLGSDPQAAGDLSEWAFRVERYLGYRDVALRLPSPWNFYGGFRGGPEKNRGRLTMLLSGAHVVAFRTRDLEALLEGIRERSLSEILAQADEGRGLYDLVQAIGYADEAAALLPEDQNAATFIYGLMAFVQWASPFSGIDLAPVLPGARGLPGLRRGPFVTGWQGGWDALQALADLEAPCDDAVRCAELGGVEGVVVVPMTFGMLSGHLRSPEEAPSSRIAASGSFGEAAAAFLRDELGRDCGTYACQRTTVVAPFKTIGALLFVAESYARAGDLEASRRVFDQLRARAALQAFPFPERIDAAEALILGKDGSGGALVRAWWRGDAHVGAIQLPLPPSTRYDACSTCHFGGEPPEPGYFYGD